MARARIRRQDEADPGCPCAACVQSRIQLAIRLETERELKWDRYDWIMFAVQVGLFLRLAWKIYLANS